MTTYDSTTVYDAASLTFDGNLPGLANLPVVGVFIAFDDGPYVADPDWVEVTDYVREIAIRRGRQDDLQQFPAGSASVVLDNRDRLFDPFNTAGTYNGKLKPRRQIKIVGQWAGVNYPLFRGFVAGWPVEYSEGGKDSTVTIDCFDALGLLATEVQISDYVGDYTLSLGPSNYVKLNEGENVTRYENLVDPTAYIETIGKISVIDTLVPAVPGNAIYGGQIYTPALPAKGSLTPITNAFWFNAGGSNDVRIIYDGTSAWLQMRFLSGSLFVEARHSGNRYSATVTIADTTFRPTETNHIVLTYNPATTSFTCYINGQAATVGAVTTAAQLLFRSYELSANSCAIQEWSTYERILSASEAALLYQYGTGDVIESCDSRIRRVIGRTSFPASSYDLQSSSVNVAQLVGGVPANQELYSVVTSENGEWFADSANVLQFVARYGWADRTRSNTSQVTFTDTGTGVYYDAGAVRLEINADQIRNNVQVQFSSNGLVSSEDASSVSEFGSASESLSTILPTPTEAQTLADYRVDIYSQPKIRVEPFLVKGQRNPSYDWPRLLALELLDRFTFVRTPSVGSAISKPMLLQSIEHRFTPGTWETIINGSARYTGWFVLDSSLLDGEDVLL